MPEELGVFEPESLERMKQAAALGVGDMVFFAVEAPPGTMMISVSTCPAAIAALSSRIDCT